MKPSKSRPMLYQNTYVWLVFLSALDIMLTWVVLYHGGREVNALAEGVIRRYGLPGLVAFKFALVVFVIAMCETAGRRNAVMGRRLARAAVAINCVPVSLAFYLLLSRT